MNTKALPSNFKSLSLAISQVILLSGGVAATAAAGADLYIPPPPAPTTCTAITTGSAFPISSDTNGCFKQLAPGAVSVTLDAGKTLDASGYAYGIYAESGSITLGDNAQIKISDSTKYASGIEMDSPNGTGDRSVTLGAGASIITSSDSDNEDSEVDGIDIDAQEGKAVVTLGNGSKVSATASAVYEADAEAISVSSDTENVKAQAEIKAEGAAVSATAITNSTNGYQNADSEALRVYSSSNNASASALVDLQDSSVNATSELAGQANAKGIYAYADSDEQAETHVELSNSTTQIEANAEKSSNATGISSIAGSQYDSSSIVELNSGTFTVKAQSESENDNVTPYAGAVGIISASLSSTAARSQIILNDTTTSVTAQAIATHDSGQAKAFAVGTYSTSFHFSDSNDAEATVTLNGGNLTTSATATQTSTESMSSATAKGIATKYDAPQASSIQVNLNSDASLVVSSTGDEAESTAIDITSYSNNTDAESSINLQDSSIESNAEGQKAFSTAINANSYSRLGNALNDITLNNSSISATSTAEGYARSIAVIATGNSEHSPALLAIGPEDEPTEAHTTNTISLNDSSVEASASGDEALAMGTSNKYLEEPSDNSLANSTNIVDLNNASISVTSSGTSQAAAIGTFFIGESSSITLTDSSISATASASEGGSIAFGIGALSELNTAITLNNSTINVSNQAEGSTSAGIMLAGNFSDTASTVELNNSDIVVTAETSEASFGIMEQYYGQGAGTLITLDANSSIQANKAVYSYAENSSLTNAGTINGDVTIATINNSGAITGDVYALALSNSGTITGLIEGNTINNSGHIYGLVGGNTLNVNNGGVIAGTADVATLNVAAGGELQAIMDDTTKTDEAHFTAVNATLADGAKIHINATSKLFDVDLKGADYLILKADESLDANEENLVLRASGLVGVEWAENCDALSLCVNVRALNLKELAEESQASSNSIKAASAAQSVLAQLAGTDKGDAFMEFFGRIADSGNWSGVEGSSNQGSSLAASNASERVATRYIQRMMKAGRSSGEEFQGERGLWIQALQVNGDGDSTSGVAGFDVDTTGLAMGYNAELQPGLLIGGAFSYANSEVDSDDHLSESESDNYMATLYTQWTQGAWFANGMFTYGQGDNDGIRTLAGDRIRADYDSDMLSVRFQGGRSFTAASGLSLSPRVELNYNHTDIDAYDEKGSVAALSVGSQSYETIEVGVGAELSKAFVVDRSVLTPYLDVVVYQDLSQDQVQTNNRFVLGGDNFVTDGSDVAKTNVSATMGLDYAMSSASSLRASYEYFGNSNYKSSAWMLRYSYSF